MRPVKLLESAASTAVHAAGTAVHAAGTAVHTVRHPISAAAYATGLARGLVGVLHGGHDGHGDTASGAGAETGPRPVPTQRAAEPQAPTASPETQTVAAPPKPQRVPKPVPEIDELPEPIVIEPEDEDPGEAFTTEPKAVSRESAHGGRAATDAEVDAWVDGATERGSEVDIETPVGTTGAGVGHNPDTAEAGLEQRGTQPVLDPGTAKAILKETETLRKAAEREPE